MPFDKLAVKGVFDEMTIHLLYTGVKRGTHPVNMYGFWRCGEPACWNDSKIISFNRTIDQYSDTLSAIYAL
jgi:hypothetical protein